MASLPRKEAQVSYFGDRVKALRMQMGLTLEEVARSVGTHKGYISGIENARTNPPSVKLIKKYAKVLGQDVRMLVGLAWVDKAPKIIRKEAERFFEWRRTDLQVRPPPEASREASPSRPGSSRPGSSSRRPAN